MKILILSDDFPPQSFGGAGMVAFRLAQGLRKSGNEIFIITARQNKADAEILDYQGLKVFRIYTNYHERWRAYLSLYNPQTVSKVEKIIQEIKPDVVHAHNVHSSLSYYCFKIAKKYAKALFLTVHDVMLFNYGKLATTKYLKQFDCRTSWLDHLKQAQKRYNPFRNIIIRHYLKYVDKIFAVSNALREALNKNDIKNVEVLYNGIDAGEWQVSPEKIEEFKNKHNLQNKKIIFFGGRISGLKGIKQINQAMTIVRKEIPQAILLIVGKEGIGWLSGDELKAAYFSSDVVVVPSICFDSFPTSVLEAMACQKPVVVTHFGGSPEIVQDGITGFIVNPFNIELMAEKIIDLFKNPQKAKQFGEAGHKRVKEHFNLDSQVAKTIFWYQKLTFAGK